MEVTAKEPHIRPVHIEGETDIEFKVGYKEPISEGIGEPMLVIKVPNESKQAVVGFTRFIREQGDHAWWDIDTSEEADEDECLEKENNSNDKNDSTNVNGEIEE